MMATAAALSWRECVNLSDMTEEELADLAINGFDPDLDDADLDHYLVITPEGRLSVRTALGSDLHDAVTRGDVHRSGTLKQILLRFMQIYVARTT